MESRTGSELYNVRNNLTGNLKQVTNERRDGRVFISQRSPQSAQVVNFNKNVMQKAQCLSISTKLRLRVKSLAPTFWMTSGYTGCARIIRTCTFPRFSPLRWNRWSCGYWNCLKYSSKVKAKCHTLPGSVYYSVQSLVQVSVGELFFFFFFVQSTKQVIEGQSRLPQRSHWYL